MLPIRTVLAALAFLAVAACVNSPPSRTASESNLDVTLAGVAAGGGAKITIQAVDQNTGTPVTLGHTFAAMTGIPFVTSAGTHYTAFPWTYDAGVLANNYWSPQAPVDDLKAAQGHLELFASDGGLPFRTFSQEADSAAMMSGLDPAAAGGQFADGSSTVLFDQTGVGSGAEGSWVSDRGMVSNPPGSGFSSVAWSVGHYTVENGTKTIYGLICTPTNGGTHPVVIYNHGGVQGTPGGNLNGVLTAGGWTQQPDNWLPDSLGQCLDWAKRGWIFATSAYRGGVVNITAPAGVFSGGGTWTSTGIIQFCLGEVTDAMALTDLVVHHAAAISVGGGGQQVTLSPNGELFMYGYSHGGCITWRAVEQGAPINAFSVIEGFTDMRLGYLIARNMGTDALTAANNSGAYQTPGVGIYQPDMQGVMGYNWRSAHYFATRGDLDILKFKTMPILILHGDVDIQGAVTTANPTPLAHAAEISADLRATNIFVGPNNFTPAASQPCIAGAPGAPLPATPPAPASCPIGYIKKNPGDACVNDAAPPVLMGSCATVSLPLPPAPGQPQQQHYLVVFHNMNHVNGGLAIQKTFDAFVLSNFGKPAGCDGLQFNCATD